MRSTKSVALLGAVLITSALSALVRAQTVGAQTASGQYTIGPSDVLKITVFNETQLSGSYRVESDGSIVYAILGRLPVAGRTERDIATMIEKALADGWINNPQVAVQVEHFRSRTIFIAGEVRTPGKYPLQGDNTLLEVLALAGSLTSNASNEVVVVRPRNAESRAAPTLPDTGDDAEVIRIDLQAIEQGRMSGNIQLQDGDTVFVPRTEKFYISGHVRSPNAYPYTKGMTVQQAIALAGGLTDRGSTRGIKVRRETRPGSGEYREISVKLNDPVQPNDTIVIRQRYI
jgi:polysaccharide export outer membrane protein